MACRLKVTKTVHYLWKDWEKIRELYPTDRLLLKPVIGKWYYRYENKYGSVGLIKINFSLTLKRNGKFQNYCWESCGNLEMRQFATKTDAEAAIYKSLKEKKK